MKIDKPALQFTTWAEELVTELANAASEDHILLLARNLEDAYWRGFNDGDNL